MPGTAVWRQLRGVDADWSVDVAMQANILHTLQVANWQRGADAKEAKSRKHYPQPVMSPAERAKQRAATDQSAVLAAKLIQFRERTYARGA